MEGVASHSEKKEIITAGSFKRGKDMIWPHAGVIINVNTVMAHHMVSIMVKNIERMEVKGRAPIMQECQRMTARGCNVNLVSQVF